MSEACFVRERLERLERHAGASGDDVRVLLEAMPVEWPEEYLACIRWSDGLEGYVGGRGYLWLWPTRDVPRLNTAYGVGELAPGLVLFGSDAASLGYGFDFGVPERPVISIEMAAMHREYLSVVAPSFNQFIEGLASEPWPEGDSEPEEHGPPEWLRGKIIHQRHPIVLGGSPTDPENQIAMPREEHAAVTLFFARILHRIREQTKGSGEGRRRRTRG